MKWAALTVSAVAVSSLGLLGYHRTLPPCFQRADSQDENPYLQASPYAPTRNADPVVYQRVNDGFFNCR